MTQKFSRNSILVGLLIQQFVIIAVQSQEQQQQQQSNSNQRIVLLGENPRTCNILGDLEIEGEEIWMGPRPQYAFSAQECCALCKIQENCNAWSWCQNPNGCDGNPETFTQCTLKTYLTDFPQWKNEGEGWISGYLKTNCPLIRRERQMVDYSNYAEICASDEKICSRCMCELSKEFLEYNGDLQDLGLCQENLFFGSLGLPKNIGGAGISTQNLENLKKCPVSSRPCIRYQNSATFFTPRIGYDAQNFTNFQNGEQCFENIEPLQCAESCEAAGNCNAFTYNPGQSGGKCCLLGDPPREVWFNPQGWQTYFRMEPEFDPNSIIYSDPIKINEIQTVPDENFLELEFAKSAEQAFSVNLEDTLILGFGCGACHDEAPPQSQFSCDQYRAWGLCDSGFLAGADFPNGYCALTCDRCSCVGLPDGNATNFVSLPPPVQGLQEPIDDPCFCSDFPPENYNCGLVNQLGLCNYFTKDKNSMVPEGYCQTTCGRCDCPMDKLCLCSDVVPPGQWPCDRQKNWDKCEVDWMFDAPAKGGYCQITCGRCPCIAY